METFRVFKEVHAAEDLAVWLRDRGLRAAVADTSPPFDPTFANSIFNREWVVRIPPEDFSKAGELLRHYYTMRLGQVPPDYYLFTFSDAELMEILAKPDEWGDLDYVLAQSILESRGHHINEQQLCVMREQRISRLSQPEEQDASDFVLWGYILCFVFGLLGSLIGWHLMSSQKILPDGQKVPRFSARARLHGKRIFWIGLIITIAFFLVRMFQSIFWTISFSPQTSG